MKKTSNTSYFTAIGVLRHSFGYSYVCSVYELQQAILRDGDNCPYDARKYCDFRYETNLSRFNYDPYTGKKIDWKEVKRLLLDFGDE